MMKYKKTVKIVGSLFGLVVIGVIIWWFWLRTPKTVAPIAFLEQGDEQWVDSLINAMTLEQKLGQLLMVRADASNPAIEDSLVEWLDLYAIGGLQLYNAPLEKQVMLGNYCRFHNPQPMFVEMSASTPDVEYTMPQPFSFAVVARNDSLFVRYVEKYANYNQIARNNISFSPSYLPAGKAQGNAFSSAFGVETADVKSRTEYFINTLEDNKILPIASRFESYYSATDTYDNYDSLLSFHRYIIAQNTPAILLDKQLHFDSINQQPNPLRYVMQEYDYFHGLIFSDILLSEPIDYLQTALLIQADVVLVENNIALVYSQLLKLYDEGIITDEMLENRLYKILMAKSWLGLRYKQYAQEVKLRKWFENSDYKLFIRQMFEQTVTVVNNAHGLLPFANLEKRNMLIQPVGEKVPVFNQFVQYYHRTGTAPCIAALTDSTTLNLQKYAAYNTVIFTLNNVEIDSLQHAVFLESLRKLDQRKNIVIVNFSHPYLLRHFSAIESIVQVYDTHPVAQEITAQILFAGVGAQGELPMYVSEKFPQGAGEKNRPFRRLKYTIPEEAGMSLQVLQTIDSIALAAIRMEATPGCQVVVAKGGKVVYHKAFGYHTYERRQPVTELDLYDLASITKVAATTLAFMKLYEQDTAMHITDSIRYYLNDTANCTFNNVQIRQFLTHQSGLQPAMPIVRYILRKPYQGQINRYIKDESDSIFDIKVAENHYFSSQYLDTLWEDTKRLEVDTSFNYQYSDANFNILLRLVEILSAKSIRHFVDSVFYHRLGIETTYIPLETIDARRIPPTANDRYWRRQLLRGYVHDETAALYGGVAGNAGLFSSANDLAVLFQMLLNNGKYADIQYLNKETVELFTTQQNGSSRGLGFDINAYGGFGHTGFTGNAVWADKRHQLVYVFLSNRVHPSVKNTRLYDENIRFNILNVIYQSFPNQITIKK